MLSTYLWITLFVVLWIYVLWSRRKMYKLMLQIPGPIGLPLIGSAHKLGNNRTLKVLKGMTETYGSSWLGWFGPFPVYFLSDPVIIQQLLTSPHFVNKTQIAYNIVEEILGKGLIALNEPEWSQHRKILNPAFAHKALLTYNSVFNNEGNSLIQELDAFVGKGENNLLSLFSNLALRIATQTTMGTDVKKEEVFQNGTLLNKYQSALETGTLLVLNPSNNISYVRQLNGLQKILDECKTLTRTFIQKMINKAIQEDSQNSNTENMSNVFIKLAIENFKSGVFNYQDVEDEANTLFFAAFETTALTINYALMHLAMFPEYQERVFEEIKSAFPKTGDFEVSYDDIQKLEYLGMVINETMRLMPPLPLAPRKLSADVQLSNGIVLPKGLQCVVSILHTQRNKEVWGPEADIFNPDNCLPRNLQDKNPFSLIPFLKGKRNCIGWKYALILVKITLVKVLRNYEFSTSYRFDELVFVDHALLKLKDPPKLQLRRRL